MTVLAIDKWASNADLILSCVELGYLRDEWTTLDPTYGVGTFWKKWRPKVLIGTDIHQSKCLNGEPSDDFTNLTWRDRSFDCVVFDPPYKLNGAPTTGIDSRYGVDVVATREARMELCRAGIRECARVLGDGHLLVKCQDQVNGGKVRWQSIDFTLVAESCGLGLVDRFDFLSYRAQPSGVRQVHARRNSSQLLVFKRGW